MKKIYILLAVLSLLVITGCNKTSKTEEIEEKKEEIVRTEARETEIKVEQQSLEYKEGISYIKFTISNVSSEDLYIKQVEISYLKDGETEKLVSIVDDTLVPGQIIEMQASAEYDLSIVENIEYKVIKG